MRLLPCLCLCSWSPVRGVSAEGVVASPEGFGVSPEGVVVSVAEGVGVTSVNEGVCPLALSLCFSFSSPVITVSSTLSSLGFSQAARKALLFPSPVAP